MKVVSLCWKIFQVRWNMIIPLENAIHLASPLERPVHRSVYFGSYGWYLLLSLYHADSEDSSQTRSLIWTFAGSAQGLVADKTCCIFSAFLNLTKQTKTNNTHTWKKKQKRKCYLTKIRIFLLKKRFINIFIAAFRKKKCLFVPHTSFFLVLKALHKMREIIVQRRVRI